MIWSDHETDRDCVALLFGLPDLKNARNLFENKSTCC